MTKWVCNYCKKTSGTTKISNGLEKGKEKPAMSERGCIKSPSGLHNWRKQ